MAIIKANFLIIHSKIMRFEKSAGAIVFYRHPEGKIEYLLLLHGGDYWNFPKGHIDKNESEIETARREIEEETGLKEIEIIPDFKDREIYFFRAPEKDYVVERRNKLTLKTAVFFLAESKTKDVKISFEHKAYEWLEFEKAVQRLTKYKKIKKMIEKADKFLKG
jgi:bis(5'-nucleosidyl)-tetraphosphatase